MSPEGKGDVLLTFPPLGQDSMEMVKSHVQDHGHWMLPMGF